MKKPILIAGFALLCISASAQKLEKPKIDKITGDTTLSTKEEWLNPKFSLVPDLIGVSVTKLHGSYLLDFHIAKGISVYFDVNEGDRAVFKFKDGSVLELQSHIHQQSRLLTSSYGNQSSANFIYALNDDSLQKLKSGEITVIRIETSKGNFDYDIKENKSLLIAKHIALIAK